MRQIMGPQPIPMRVTIDKNLTSNNQTICIIKYANGRSMPDAMAQLSKTAHPYKGTHLDKSYLWWWLYL